MELFGIGMAELIVIFLIMLVVAGPKRMIRWAYWLGQGTAKLRALWGETMAMIQKEVDAAGLDVQLPKEVPTRHNLNRYSGKVWAEMTRPAHKLMDEVKTDLSLEPAEAAGEKTETP